MGERPARWVSLIFAHDLELSLAAVTRRSVTVMPKDALLLSFEAFDPFRARAPRAPVADFSRGRGGGVHVAALQGRAVAASERRERLQFWRVPLRSRNSGRRYGSVRKPRCVVLGSLNECAAHRDLSAFSDLRFDFRASMRFEI